MSYLPSLCIFASYMRNCALISKKETKSDRRMTINEIIRAQHAVKKNRNVYVSDGAELDIHLPHSWVSLYTSGPTNKSFYSFGTLNIATGSGQKAVRHSRPVRSRHCS